MKTRTLSTRILAVFLAAVIPTGCSDFVSVTNPNVVSADGIDPEADGPLISGSAFRNFVIGFGGLSLFGSRFTNESWAGDSSNLVTEFALRDIDPTNGRLILTWDQLSRGLAASEDAIDILEEGPDPGSNIHLARVYHAAGWSYLLMAEAFCVGTVRGGPPLGTSEMLSFAADRLQAAQQVAGAATGGEAEDIVHAAAIGLGRTALQDGRPGDAVQAVAGVPTEFEFVMHNLDDPANRDRLGNRLWWATVDRASLVVPPRYRELADEGDPRIQYQDFGLNAYDGILPMYGQVKMPSWGAPYRLTRGLEARYIEVEAAGDEGDMLTFVNERRQANGHDPVADLTGDALLTEFLLQKSLDFWLEAKRMGDFRRHGMLVPDILPTGAQLYKPAPGPVGSDACFPLPVTETNSNPNF